MAESHTTGGQTTGPNLPTSGAELTPIFANYAHILTSAETVRLTFGEVLPGRDGARFHTAIVLPLSAAKAITELVLSLITPTPEKPAG